MRRERKRLLAAMLAFVMVFMTFGGQISTLNVQAATTKTMAHLKAGSGNGNGHFNGTSEAFVLSDKADITNEALSFQFKFESTTAETRFRFVTKYVSNSDWAYIAYDGATNHWFAETGRLAGHYRIAGIESGRFCKCQYIL